MQQLQFEASWNKALSGKDRAEIEKVFEETKHANGRTIHFAPLREALNHKKDLLITVLVHNFNQEAHAFRDKRLCYSVGEEVIADHVFTLPALNIPPKTSMPWTFIFPRDSYAPRVSLENGRLDMHYKSKKDVANDGF